MPVLVSTNVSMAENQISASGLDNNLPQHAHIFNNQLLANEMALSQLSANQEVASTSHNLDPSMVQPMYVMDQLIHEAGPSESKLEL